MRASSNLPVAGPMSGPNVVAGSVDGPTTSEAAAYITGHVLPVDGGATSVIALSSD